MSQRYYRHEVEQVAAALQAGKHTPQIAHEFSGPLGRSYEGIQTLAQRLARGEVNLSQYIERPQFTQIAPNAPDRLVDASLTVSRHVSPVVTKQRPTHGKGIAVGDFHFPYTNWSAFNALRAFARDYKPDFLVLLGDIWDFESLSFFIRDDHAYASTLPTPGQSLREGREKIIEALRSDVGDECYIALMEGNHEYRLELAQRKDKKAQDWSIAETVKGLVDEVLPYVSEAGANVFSVGKLNFMHWPLGRKRVNIYHARPVAEQYAVGHMVLRYGHTHDIQTHAAFSPVNVHEFYVARSIGCMCERNPDWLLNAPNRWVPAFEYSLVQEDGHFHDDVPIIVGGKFMACGKVYEPSI